MKRAVVLLLVAAAILSTVGRLSAQEVPPELSAQEVPEISRTMPERPRIAAPEIEFPHSAMPVGLTAPKIVSTPKFPLTAPEIKPFALTPTERLAVNNFATTSRLGLGGKLSVGLANANINLTNGGGEMTLLTLGNRVHGATPGGRAHGSSYSLGLTGVRQSYPSMGFSSSVALGQTWSPADRVTIYGGVYVSDNMFHRGRFKDLGVSGRVRLKVAERVALVGFGSYSMYNSGSPERPHPLMMYPGRNYGGGVQLRLTDRFGLEGGVRRDYNVFTRKWETSPYIIPVFY